MKVKVGGRTYDANVEPVMIILTPQDKANIAAMTPKATKYCAYPHNGKWGKRAIELWMEMEAYR